MSHRFFRETRLKKEQEKKKKTEANLYTVVKVAREEDMAEQIGRDIFFDLVDHDRIHSFRIHKEVSFKYFKEEVAKEFGIPVRFQRFWLFAKRKNHTFRPLRPLDTLEETESVGHIQEVSNKADNAELKLFLEMELGESGPVLPPDRTKDILLFFKLFDNVTEELRYVGRLFVSPRGTPAEILTKLNEMAGYSPNEDLDLYEEIKFEPTVMCERIDMGRSFKSSQLENGDIICYQKFRLDIPSFFNYVRSRQVVSAGKKTQYASNK